MNLKFDSQFPPHSHRNPNRGPVLHRQQTSSAFQTGNWREAVPQSCSLHLLWQRNLAHSEWPTDSPDPDTYNLKKQTQKHKEHSELNPAVTITITNKYLSCHTRQQTCEANIKVSTFSLLLLYDYSIRETCPIEMQLLFWVDEFLPIYLIKSCMLSRFWY